MTPAIKLLEKNNIPHTIHEYVHEPSTESYGLEAAKLLEASPLLIYKTLVVQLDNKQLAVAIIPVENSLNLKSIAKIIGNKKASMASKGDVVRSTGYVLGGVSPLALKKRISTIIDDSAKLHSKIFISGGKRGLEIELSPIDLAKLCSARFADIKQ